MRVDHARHDDAVLGVDLDGALRHVEPLTDGLDPLPHDEDVGAGENRPAGVHGENGAAAQDDGPAALEVRAAGVLTGCCHGCLPLAEIRRTNVRMSVRPRWSQRPPGLIGCQGLRRWDTVKPFGHPSDAYSTAQSTCLEALMPRRDADPDFIESIARGFDVIRAFEPGTSGISLSDVAAATGLARPTVRRILRTLETLGYVRSIDGRHTLTPRVLDLGLAYVQSVGLWDVARPHLDRLVAHTHESSSIAQLDGSDIVYVARVSVPKIIALAVHIGTRFPAPATSLGKVLLADLSRDELTRVLAEPSRAGVEARPSLTDELDGVLRDVRAKGWAATDEQLALGVRSVAVPLRNGDGRVFAAVNVTVHAAETTVDTLLGDHLPHLLRTAADISADFAARDALPLATAAPARLDSPRITVPHSAEADNCPRAGRANGDSVNEPLDSGPAGPLAGLLVADFSRILAGPYASMMLGDLGADVVKVEAPGGDDTRTWLPPHAVRPRPTTSPSTATSGRSSSTSALRMTAPSPTSWPRAPTSSSRTSSPVGSQVRSGLCVGRRAQPGRRLRLDQRVRFRRRGRPPGLRPDRPGHVRPDEPHG